MKAKTKTSKEENVSWYWRWLQGARFEMKTFYIFKYYIICECTYGEQHVNRKGTLYTVSTTKNLHTTIT